MAEPVVSMLESERTAPKIGAFDATMLVMGGIVGAGIFSNPSVVAKMVHSGLLMMAVWGIGGVIALAGAFVYAALAARHPARGGHYAYMRDAFHPAIAFMFGWAILLVVQTGGIAAVSVIFARYFLVVVQLHLSETTIAVAIALQGTLCAIVAASGSYESIMSYVTSVDFIFYGLAALALFVFRARDRERTGVVGYTVPGHPWTTAFFMIASWIVVGTTIYSDPRHSLIGIGALALGVPTYFVWMKLKKVEPGIAVEALD